MSSNKGSRSAPATQTKENKGRLNNYNENARKGNNDEQREALRKDYESLCRRDPRQMSREDKDKSNTLKLHPNQGSCSAPTEQKKANPGRSNNYKENARRNNNEVQKEVLHKEYELLLRQDPMPMSKEAMDRLNTLKLLLNLGNHVATTATKEYRGNFNNFNKSAMKKSEQNVLLKEYESLRRQDPMRMSKEDKDRLNKLKLLNLG